MLMAITKTPARVRLAYLEGCDEDASCSLTDSRSWDEGNFRWEFEQAIEADVPLRVLLTSA